MAVQSSFRMRSAAPSRVFLFMLAIALLVAVTGRQPVGAAQPSSEPSSPDASQPAAEAASASEAAAGPATNAGTLGAGFRYSTYGVRRELPDEYWAGIAEKMVEKFPDATPEAIWIVGNYRQDNCQLTFPGEHADPHLRFSTTDRNEAALKLFDERGIRVWLQVEPGDAPMEALIDVVLGRYGKHPCVIGFGVDVEWYHSDGTPEGRAVTDSEAAAWVAAARRHNPEYRVFLKHWEIGKMPPTYRDGLVFVNDSQQHRSFERMAREFDAWGKHFAPAKVAYQYGYRSDQPWWSQLDDPPGTIGKRILEGSPNTVGLYWVNFTAVEAFPPE